MPFELAMNKGVKCQGLINICVDKSEPNIFHEVPFLADVTNSTYNKEKYTPRMKHRAQINQISGLGASRIKLTTSLTRRVH